MDLRFKSFCQGIIKDSRAFSSDDILEKYFAWFKNKRFAKVLYQGTPKTKSEVKAWIIDCIEDKSKRYFFVLKDGRLVGHIGLRGIDFERKYAAIGSFFADGWYRHGSIMEKALKFIIEKARENNLSLITADFMDKDQPQIKAFIKVGFTPNPQAPHYLTFRL